MHLDIKTKKKKKKQKSNKQNIEDNLGKKLVNEQEIHQKELEDNENTIDVSKSVGTNI